MDVGKVSPLGTATQQSAQPQAPAGERGATGGAGADGVAGVDRVDIHTLDTPGALRILVAEAFAELGLAQDLSASPQSAGAAARLLIEAFLETQSAVAAEAADAEPPPGLLLEAATARALDVVSAWHDVAPAVVEAAREAQSLVARLLADQPPYGLWLRPEWLGLAPRMEALRRRRRAQQRRLIDPDVEPALTPERAAADDEERR